MTRATNMQNLSGFTAVLFGIALLHAPVRLEAQLPKQLPPGMGAYVMVLWPAGSPIPGDPFHGTVKKLPEPDILKRGGQVLDRLDNRRIILLPIEKVKEIRNDPAVVYLQRIWMGESFDGWNEAYVNSDTPESTMLKKEKASEADVDLQWGPKAYAYDGSGNITQIGADRFSYDSVTRLVQATVGNKTENYQYDAFGNLIQRQVVGANAVTIDVDPGSNRIRGTTYDAAGNLTSSDAGRRSYAYDSLNALKQVTPGPGYVRRMVYDANDERLGMIIVGDSVSRWTIRDFDGRVLREYKADNLRYWYWEQDYFYGERELVGGETQEWGYTSTYRYGGRRHYHLDHLGSVRLVTDNTTTTRARSLSEHDYFPFGTTITKTYQEQINWGDLHVDAMRFAGHWRDFLGLFNVDNTEYIDYMHARHYDPNLGRFLSVDPTLNLERALRQPQNWNRYSYVMNNPLRYTDPDGRDHYQEPGFTKPMTAENLQMDESTPWEIKASFYAEGALLTMAAGGPLRSAAFETSLLLMRNPGTVLAAYKLLDSMGGNVGGRINPAGQTGGKLDYLLGNVASEKSLGKGGFFAGVMGFTAKTLDGAIRSHFADNFKNGVLQKDGRLAVTGAMTGANGIVTTVKTVWQWNLEKKVWDMITAVPAR